MKVLELKNVSRKDVPIYYRREFQAEAVFQFMETKTESLIDFALEQTPMGSMRVHVEFLEKPEYPVIPLLQVLKTYILALDKEGGLP